MLLDIVEIKICFIYILVKTNKKFKQNYIKILLKFYLFFYLLRRIANIIVQETFKNFIISRKHAAPPPIKLTICGTPCGSIPTE